MPLGTDSLRSIDLNKYTRLLNSMAPGLEGLALCISRDTPEIFSADWPIPESAHPIGLGEADNRGEHHTTQTGHTKREKKRLCLPLWSHTNEKITTLVGIYHNEANSRQGVDLHGICSAFSAIGECILTEYRLNEELNAMADELIGRHEELNLIYDTDDQVNQYQQGRESLDRLVQNCIEYLDVGMAALVLPEKNQHFFQYNDPILYSHLIVSQPWTRFYPHIRDNKTSLVINSAADSSALNLPPVLPHRIIGCPVFEGNNEVCGSLFVLRDAKGWEFTNNDRNLLDVMARKASKIIQANYDALTGLLLRNGFEFELHQALSHTQKANIQHCMLLLNLDRIHIINDIAGHKIGDRLIKQVARLVRQQVRDSDVVARLGGDVFGVLLKNCAVTGGVSIAEALCQKINELEFECDTSRYEVSASIGITMVTANIQTVKDVISAAEIACNTAKEQGGNRAWTYQHGDSDLVRRKREMVLFNGIKEALRDDRFRLYCQPIASLSARDCVMHSEILIRQIDAQGKTVSPGDFLPVAERYHLMPTLDRWVVKNSLETLSEYWASLGEGIWSINLSGQSLGKPDFLEFVLSHLDSAAIAARNICFEITETAAIDNLEKAREFIQALKDNGCAFALDDFGTGLSSFTYLKDLPIDYLKIDGSFVRNILEDPISAAMVASVNHIGHIMGLKTIAEYVENDLIKDALRSFGIDYAQGYAIAKPRPLRAYLVELACERRAALG